MIIMLDSTISFFKSIWLWCNSRERWVSTPHIPDKKIYLADRFYRNFKERFDWNLNDSLLQKLTSKSRKQVKDLFDSQISKYLLYNNDFKVIVIGLLSLKRKAEIWHIFRFSACQRKCLPNSERLQYIIFMPEWLIQYWHPILKQQKIY